MNKKFWKIAASVVVVAAIGSTCLLSRNITYDRNKPPRLPLGAAYALAVQALGTGTNEFYCTGAELARARSADGEWLFSFQTTNGTPKWVTVEFNGNTHIERILTR